MAMPSRSSTSPDARAAGARFLIVEARFYESIAALLLDGASSALTGAGAVFDCVTVPGALEIPIAMAIALDAAKATQRPYAGAIALGCVIRGETFHFDIVARESARAVLDLGVARNLACGNGILTVDTEAQAIVRADPARGDKGGDAARAALALHRISVGAR